MITFNGISHTFLKKKKVIKETSKSEVVALLPCKRQGGEDVV
jgi:hypothetical protein